MINEKYFPKSIIQKELTNGLFINLSKITSLATFARVYSNSKEVSYLPWRRKYPNLKTTFHLQPKFFLWVKFLKNLLLAKYLTTVSHLACTCAFYRPDNNSKEKPWVLKVFKCNEKHGVIRLVIVFTPRVITW